MTHDSSESAGEEFTMHNGFGSRTFYCENCPQTFHESHQLQEHIRNEHPGARPFPCTECGKTFATSSGLKQHQHIHSSVKPFQCEVCLKAYTQFSNLCRHKRMHADCRQQIKCRGCGQCFSTMHSLNKHKRYCDRMMHTTTPLDVPMVGSNSRTPLTVDTSQPSSIPQNIRHIYNTPSVTPRFPFMSSLGSSLPVPSFAPGFPIGVWMPPVFPGMTASEGPKPVTPLLQQKLEEKSAARDKLSDLGSSPTSDLGHSEDDHSVSPASERRTSPVSEPERRTSSVSPPAPMKGFHGVPSIPITPMLGLRNAPTFRNNKPELSPIEPVSKHDEIDVDSHEDEVEEKPSSLNNNNKSVHRPYDFSKNTKAEDKKEAQSEAPLDLSVGNKQEKEPIKVNSTREFIKEESKCESRESTPKPVNFKSETPKSPIDDLEKPLHKSFFPSPMHWTNPMALLHIQELERLQYMQKMAQLMSFSTPRSPPTSNGLVRPMPIPAISPPSLDHNPAFPGFQVRSPTSGLPYNGGYMRTGKDKYVCKFCGKVFPRSANLTRHLRTHTGEQPYKCKYCDRSFSISSNLQRHIRNIHNKEKPFRCNVCDRSFGQQTNLDRHLRKHETEGMLNSKIIDSPLSDHIDDDEDIKIDVDDTFEYEDNESRENSVCDDLDRWSNVSEDGDRSYSPSEISSNGLIDTNFSITAQIEKQKQLTIEAH